MAAAEVHFDFQMILQFGYFWNSTEAYRDILALGIGVVWTWCLSPYSAAIITSRGWVQRLKHTIKFDAATDRDGAIDVSVGHAITIRFQRRQPRRHIHINGNQLRIDALADTGATIMIPPQGAAYVAFQP
jgi:hypothetical protein